MEDMGLFYIAKSSRRQTTCTALCPHRPCHNTNCHNPIQLAMVRHFPVLQIHKAHRFHLSLARPPYVNNNHAQLCVKNIIDFRNRKVPQNEAFYAVKMRTDRSAYCKIYDVLHSSYRTYISTLTLK